MGGNPWIRSTDERMNGRAAPGESVPPCGTPVWGREEGAAITFEEIAKELGVSKSTVSRALSGKGRIGEETRVRIRAYAKEKGVWQEETHRKRHVGTGNLAAVIPADAYTTSFPFFQESLLGISEVAGMMKYHVMLVTGASSDISGLSELVESGKVDGAILMRSIQGDRMLQYLSERDFPTALIGTCEYDNILQVDTDNRASAASLCSLLIGQGYRRFAFLMGDMSYRVNGQRLQGCMDALDRYGVAREQQLTYHNFINMELLDSIISDVIGKKAECVICGDDVICTRLMSRMQAEGYRIPKDISIASLYNSVNLECFSPAVTAINVSARQLGNETAKQLIRRLKEGAGDIGPGDKTERENNRIALNYEILVRKSTGRIYRL